MRRQQSRPSKRVRGLKKQIHKEKVENSENVLRLAIDCGLDSHYSMSPKVGGAGGRSQLFDFSYLCMTGVEGPVKTGVSELRCCDAVP